jgi:hypothetical protein
MHPRCPMRPTTPTSVSRAASKDRGSSVRSSPVKHQNARGYRSLGKAAAQSPKGANTPNAVPDRQTTLTRNSAERSSTLSSRNWRGGWAPPRWAAQPPLTATESVRTASRSAPRTLETLPVLMWSATATRNPISMRKRDAYAVADDREALAAVLGNGAFRYSTFDVIGSVQIVHIQSLCYSACSAAPLTGVVSTAVHSAF